MLQRGWWLILLAALVALSASLTASYLATPQYQATARFIITPGSLLTSGGDASAVVDGLDTLDRPSIVATYAEVMNSRRILAEALAYLQLQNIDTLKYTIQAVVLPESSVMELTVTGPDARIVADLANGIGYQSILFARGINRVYELNFLDQAVQPVIPISPQPLRDAALSLVLGAMVGAVLAILSEQIRVPLEAYRQRLRIDPQTGVYNNRYFARLLGEELSKNFDEVLSIGIVELNGLQDYIETLPSAGLQKVLQRVTDTLRRELRGNDTIGRWDDDSFIVMLPATSGSSANRIFNRIYQALLSTVDLPQYGVSVNLDPHLGGAEYSNGISQQELLEKASSALEQARRDEENPVYIWEIRNPFWVQGE
jgi:diguanylate cyclase (GGDEF)-like protein